MSDATGYAFAGVCDWCGRAIGWPTGVAGGVADYEVYELDDPELPGATWVARLCIAGGCASVPATEKAIGRAG